MTPDQAMPGDVLLDAAGEYWQRGETERDWATFSGPVVFFGPWQPEYGPQGELYLLGRGGQPVLQFPESPLSFRLLYRA